MAESNGTPIRLVQENGNLIELEATTFALTTEREVTPTSFPAVGGSRIAIDLNKSRSLIVMQGVITDDRFTTGTAFAKGLVDFSVALNGASFLLQSNIDAIINATIFSVELKDSSGNLYTARFIQSASLGRNGNDITIKTNSGTYVNQTQLPTYFADWVNNATGGNLSATIVDSEITGYSNGAVLIKQAASGSGGNQSAYPKMVYVPSYTSNVTNPVIARTVKFQGGSTGKKKSAGDKVMDLYGIINNSSREINRELTLENLSTTLGALALALPTFGLTFLNALSGDGDYIVGVQIPYNSTIQADGDTYVARNFFMPTGALQSRFSKSSEANNSPAGATFDIFQTGFTGIQGVMGKLDINYDAGESVYNFDITFYPANATI
jgi:hypothetical protein